MLLKVDIAKAYHMVEWEAVLATLYLMKFPTIWVNWIGACISSAKFAILINGHVSSWFPSNKGGFVSKSFFYVKPCHVSTLDPWF